MEAGTSLHLAAMEGLPESSLVTGACFPLPVVVSLDCGLVSGTERPVKVEPKAAQGTALCELQEFRGKAGETSFTIWLCEMTQSRTGKIICLVLRLRRMVRSGYLVAASLFKFGLNA